MLLLRAIFLLLALVSMSRFTDAFLPEVADGSPFAPFLEFGCRLVSSWMCRGLVLMGFIAYLLVWMMGGEMAAAGTPLEPKEYTPPDLRALPRALRQLREWLRRQNLPASAAKIGESIADQLDHIGETLKERERAEVAATVETLSKLLTEELTELVTRYRRVPRLLRLVPSVGMTATELLVSGLKHIDAKLRDIQNSLGTADMFELAKQARYLELKYESEARTHAVLPRAQPETSTQTASDRPPQPRALRRSEILSPPRLPGVEQTRRGLDAGDVLALGVAALVVDDLIEREHANSSSTTDDTFRGEGGAFGGAGASGDWSSEPDETSTSTETMNVDDGWESDANTTSGNTDDAASL